MGKIPFVLSDGDQEMPQGVDEPQAEGRGADVGGDGVHGGSGFALFRQQPAVQQQFRQGDDNFNGQVEKHGHPGVGAVLHDADRQIGRKATLGHQVHQQKAAPAFPAPRPLPS